MPELTQPQATALAALLNQIRPDWGAKSLMTLLWDHRHQPDYAALCQAAVTKARDTTCKTPAPIFTPGPHWTAEDRAALPQGPPCVDHATFSAHNCPCCRSEVLVGDRPHDRIGKHHNQEEKP